MSTLIARWFATRSRRLWRRVLVPAGRWTAVVLLVASSGLAVTGEASAAAEGSPPEAEPGLGAPVPVTAAGRPALPSLQAPQQHIWHPAEVAWPAPTVARVDLTAPSMRVHGTPVTLAAPAGSPAGPESVRVTVLDRSAAEAVGVDGLLIAIDTAAEPGEVELSVDYSSFAGAYGGGWASRLRLVRLPACAVTTPLRRECRVASPMASRNDTGARRVSARVPVEPATSYQAAPLGGTAATASAGPVFALMADEASESGDWTATDLEASGSWTHSGSSGGFTYRYPLRMPPAAGPTPEVSLSYSSQSHDGRTSGSNNQASWVGDGWNYQPGLVERTYRTCADDMDGGNNDVETGDLCWDEGSPSITLSLNGVSTSLVRDDSSGAWRASSDQGWRVERLGAPAAPGSGTSERWLVTTTDGTRYFFADEASSSSSLLTVPVFGNHSGEACHANEFEDSACRQAYRWMLDKVIDTQGNMTRYYYARETGHYAAAGDVDDRRAFHRAAHLTRADYGLRSGGTGPATGRLVFTPGDRCLADCWNGSDPDSENWPDTPWDLTCDATPCTGQGAPAFFSSKRLVKITSQVYNGGEFDDVDSWRLEHEFLDYGDESQVVLWLESVQHTGHVGGTMTLPKMTFTGWALPNRVNHNGIPAVWRSRLSAITTETGGITTINYSDPDCAAGDLPSAPESNTRLCYPKWWTPEVLTEPVLDYFHKYVVESVVEQETTAAGGEAWTFYDYDTTGGGTSVLWAWDDSEFTDKEHRTYSQWRGYPRVTTRKGDPDDGAQPTTRTRYYRGMHGQPLPGGGERSVQLTDSEGNQVTDHRALSGATWEEASYLGGSVDSAVTYRYWTRKTATRSHAGGDAEAFLTGVSQQDSRKRLDGTTWRRTRTTMSYDDRGRVIETSDRGDTARAGDETCTRTDYADNTSKWILTAVSRTETVAVHCGVTPDRPAGIVSDTLTYYDGSGVLGAPPSEGLPTSSEVLDAWDGGPVYTSAGAVAYDALGRPVATTDPLGEVSTKAYTPAGAGPVTRVVETNPLGHTVVMDYQPGSGLATAIEDPNGRLTEFAHDPVGRTTAVWLPGRDRQTESANVIYEYDINNDAPSVLTTKRINASGGYVINTELYDSLYRLIQTQADTPQGGRLVTETAYNSRGQVEYASGPNWDETSGPNGTFVRVEQGADHTRTWYTYDPLGREIKRELWSKNVELWQTTTAYGGSSTGFLTRITPPDGGTPTGTVTGVRGEPIEKRDYHGATATGTYDTTIYAYDPKGRLDTVTGPAGSSWSYEYDLRGRKVASHDPDSGTTTYTYDAADRITSATDARGDTLATGYDAIGRPVERWDGEIGTGTRVAAWSYDTVAGGIGMPATASTFVDGHEIVTRVGSYDYAGRPTLTMATVPPIPGLESLAGTYMAIQQFNIDGTLATLALPPVGGLPREGITYTYNAVGLPDRMVGDMVTTGDTQVYVDSTMYTAWGELAQRTLGASYDQQVYHSYSYADGTRRLTDFRLSRDAVGAPNVAHLQYEYDDAGNILSIADAVEDAPGEQERQCFVYDHLRRLTEAWAQAGLDQCAEQPSTEAMGGPAPYWSSYTFDVSGNRLSETRHGTGGEAITSDYAYPAAGGPQPHTLSTVTTEGQVDSYGYDPAGNLISRTVDGKTETIAWDAAGKPISITDEDAGATTRMVYNADGDRVARIDPNGDAHLFVAGHEISHTHATGAVTAVRTYQHNGDVIATRSTTDGLQWIASDHHGTAAWAIAAVTMAVTYRRKDPYGNPRGDQGSWPAGQEGFVRGVEDPTGLVQVGARLYDPTIGRFISDDPVSDLSNPQQLNGYAYANSNPVTFSDPTGLRVCLETCGSEEDKWYQEYLREQEKNRDQEQNAPAPPPRGENNTPGFEPVYVGTVTFTVEVNSYTYLEVEATAYIWCNDDLTMCDYYWNAETGAREVYVEYVLKTVAEDTTRFIGPRTDSGWRLLYSDCNIHGRVLEGEEHPNLARDINRALASAGIATNIADVANDGLDGFSEGSKLRIPSNPALRVAGKFLPVAGFATGIAGNLEEGESAEDAVLQSGAATLGGMAGAELGAMAGLHFAPYGLACGPLAWLCSGAIVAGFTIGGAIVGSTVAEDGFEATDRYLEGR